MQSRYQEIESYDADLWVIANDKPEKLAKLAREKGLEFPVIDTIWHR